MKAAVEGESGVMIGFVREETADGSYRMHSRRIPIAEVMMYERKLPEDFINERGNDVTDEFVEWCRPLIGGDIPEYIDFQEEYRK